MQESKDYWKKCSLSICCQGNLPGIGASMLRSIVQDGRSPNNLTMDGRNRPTSARKNPKHDIGHRIQRSMSPGRLRNRWDDRCLSFLLIRTKGLISRLSNQPTRKNRRAAALATRWTEDRKDQGTRRERKKPMSALLSLVPVSSPSVEDNNNQTGYEGFEPVR